MAKIHDKTGEELQPTGGGMRRVVADGSESVAELREFMNSLRGKSPREVLGAVANSSLIRSTAVATVGFLVIIVGLSVLMHTISPPKPPQTVKKPSGPQTAASTGSAEEPSEETAKVKAKKKATDTGTVKSGDPTLDKMGIGETKKADPNKNPLENSLDKILNKNK